MGLHNLQKGSPKSEPFVFSGHSTSAIDYSALFRYRNLSSIFPLQKIFVNSSQTDLDAFSITLVGIGNVNEYCTCNCNYAFISLINGIGNNILHSEKKHHMNRLLNTKTILDVYHVKNLKI
jgi:hypothetical protein